MDPLISGAVSWLLSQSMTSLFDAAKNALLAGMGLISTVKPLTRGEAQTLLDQYVRRLEQEIKKANDKLDQDRLALLKGAFSQVSRAPYTKAKDNLLANALNTFHTIAGLPHKGRTGTWRNAELRCVAFLGMAASHIQLNDPPELVAENLVEAIRADLKTTEQWLGTGVVELIVRKYPVLRSLATYPYLDEEFSEYLQAKQFDEALSAAEYAIGRDPAYAGSYFNKGLALSSLGRHSEALSAFEQAILADSKDMLYQYHKGTELQHLKRYSEALTTYDQVLRMGPGKYSNRNWLVWYQKYEIFLQLGRKKEAKNAYQKSIDLRADNMVACPPRVRSSSH